MTASKSFIEIDQIKIYDNLYDINITKLSICGKNSFDKNIFDLNELRVLNLFNNKIFTIPYNINKLICLEELDLSFNKISNLPEEFFLLSSLKIFNLFNNQLTELSENIIRLSSLQKLDLSYNKLKKLPYNINNMPLLKILNIEGNLINNINIIKKDIKINEWR